MPYNTFIQTNEQMTSKQISYIFLAFIAILGWNSFLIKRDAQLFEKYSPVTQLK